MMRAAHLLRRPAGSTGCAGTAEVQPDWAPVARRIREEATDNWDDKVAVERFEGKGGRFVRATGRIVAPGRVRPATRNHRPPGDRRRDRRRAGHTADPGLADVPYWTNREAIAAEEVPASLVVLGGGAIGLELAQVFARFGAGVTVVEALDRLLPLEEPEAGDLLAEVFARGGHRRAHRGQGRRVGRDGVGPGHPRGRTELPAERLLVATGRRVDLGAVGLGASVSTSRRAPSRPTGGCGSPTGVWAVGDMTGQAPSPTSRCTRPRSRWPTSSAWTTPADYRALPRVTFTDPEVGLGRAPEAQAVAAGLRVGVGAAQVPSTARGWIHAGATRA